MANQELRNRILRRATAADLAVEEAVAEALQEYYRLLARWNAKVNLTAFRLSSAGEDEAVDRLLVEPLVAARHLPSEGGTWLDVGSGGGSPAIPMKLVASDLHLRMVEVKTRKAAFLREATRILALARTEVDTARFEDLLGRQVPRESLDVVSVRAVRIDQRTLVTLQAFLRPDGKLLLFRGPSTDTLPWSAVSGFERAATYPLVPSLRSSLVVLVKKSI